MSSMPYKYLVIECSICQELGVLGWSMYTASTEQYLPFDGCIALENKSRLSQVFALYRIGKPYATCIEPIDILRFKQWLECS